MTSTEIGKELKLKTVKAISSDEFLYPTRNQIFLSEMAKAVKSNMVFIIGESGYGKTLLAQKIASRSKKRLIKKRLSSTRDDFLEAELKGVGKGQLDSHHKGLTSIFEKLNKDTTLFFDEFGHLSTEGQKLFYEIIENRTIDEQLSDKELNFKEGQIIFAMDYWHEKPDEQLLNRIMQYAVVLVLPNVHNKGFSDMDLLFESVFADMLKRQGLKIGKYDNQIIDDLYENKPENGMREIVQRLSDCNLKEPLTIKKWRGVLIAKQEKMKCLKAMNKTELRSISLYDGELEINNQDSNQENVLREMKKAFSFRYDGRKIEQQLTFLQELEYLKYSGSINKTNIKKFIKTFSLVEILSRNTSIECQTKEYFSEKKYCTKKDLEKFEKIKEKYRSNSFDLDLLSLDIKENGFDSSIMKFRKFFNMEASIGFFKFIYTLKEKKDLDKYYQIIQNKIID